MSHFGIGPFHISEGVSSIIRLLGVLMPAVSALILTSRAGGRDAIRALLARLAIWRVSWIWWVAAVLVQPALLALTGLLFNSMGGQPPISPVLLTSVAGLIVNIIFLALATLGEEIGWRGVALPSLQSRMNAINASLALGFLWAAWHIPFWLLLDTFDQFGWTYLALNFIFILLGTFYITWFFNHSRSSLLLPVAFHLSFNILNTALFPVTTSPEAFAIFIAIEFIITLLIVRHLEPPMAQAKE
jgi:membrane protease YdiL (CAAX protease family)